jgi:hypothetical protein
MQQDAGCCACMLCMQAVCVSCAGWDACVWVAGVVCVQ